MEAHNVEGTLTESGSGKFGEIELTSLVSMLLIHSTASKSDKNKVEFREGGEEMDLSVVAHELLCFIEKISVHLYELRKKFESGKGKNSAAGAIEEYLQFKTSDDQEFEVAYVGPSGHGVHREAVGCKPFFEKLNITNSEIETLCSYAEAMERHLIGDSGPESSKKFGEQGGSSAFDFLNEILSKFRTAIKTPQHFYISCVIQVNGNFDYAAGIVDDDDGDNSRKRLRKKPKDLPYIYPRSEEHPKAGLPACRHEACKPQGVIMPGYNKSFRRHGDWFKDEVTPRWEAHLVLKLLFPGLLMKDLANQCRTMILASGSLSPIPSLCAELDLHDEKAKDGRLQTKPKPLEANHVVKLSKQLLAVSVGHFPDGTPLTVSYTNYQNHNFFPRLGHALATICESIPRGGVLIFLPSYSFLNRCIKCWDPTYAGENACPEIWERFICRYVSVLASYYMVFVHSADFFIIMDPITLVSNSFVLILSVLLAKAR